MGCPLIVPITGYSRSTNTTSRSPTIDAAFLRVDAAYEKRSLAITSDLHPAGFDTIMPKSLATATVDRILHHAHLVLAEGPFQRLADATAGKGVVPLS